MSKQHSSSDCNNRDSANTTGYWNGKQVAGYLGVVPRTVERMAAQGLLRQYRFGSRAVRYKAEEVVNWASLQKAPR